jgi:hypothetical protein
MIEQHSQQDQTQKTGKAPFGVAASPFNRVKMELGIALIFGIVLWLVVDTITSSFGTQLLFLLGYGVVVSLWLIIRTRKILQQHNS